MTFIDIRMLEGGLLLLGIGIGYAIGYKRGREKERQRRAEREEYVGA